MWYIRRMKTRVYADNAATTKLFDSALEAMLPYLRESYENPSGVYEGAVLTKRAVNEARSTIAKTLEAFDREIIFTGGGSEADNLALIGVMEANAAAGRHLITTSIEHHAVLKASEYLQKRGFRVTYVSPKENGIVDVKDIEAAICEDTVLVSVMYANNELGTIQPIEEIGALCHERGILFHTDAVQAYGKLSIIPKNLHIDLLSASAHKFNGPKGVGFLYVKRGTALSGLIHGGSQEYGLRAGTENVPAVVGMASAAATTFATLLETSAFERRLTEYLYEKIMSGIEGVTYNGDFDKRVPNILNFSFDNVDGNSLLISLDMKGVCVSTGSACAMSYEEPSHVLQAIGKQEKGARESIRISLSRDNTFEEMDYIYDSLKESVDYLRRIRQS